LGPGVETGAVNDLVRHTFERMGAYIMSWHMFVGGRRLFDNLHEPLPQFRIDRVVHDLASPTCAICVVERHNTTSRSRNI
jgi:hypothetical protein